MQAVERGTIWFLRYLRDKPHTQISYLPSETVIDAAMNLWAERWPDDRTPAFMTSACDDAPDCYPAGGCVAWRLWVGDYIRRHPTAAYPAIVRYYEWLSSFDDSSDP